MPAIGERVAGFELVRQLGEGSFGTVWEAHPTAGSVDAAGRTLPGLVAVKLAKQPEDARSLAREARVALELEHPNIIRVLAIDPYADPPYLAMELATGGDLRRRLLAGKLPVGLALGIVRQILAALDYAHGKGVVHCDIKPENVLLEAAAKDEVPPVKLTDFGLGQRVIQANQSILRSDMLTMQAGNRLAGTLAYMAPEVRDSGTSEPRSDLYSVGVMLFEMITGHRPVGRETVRELEPTTPEWVDALVDKCVCRLERRWASAKDMLAEIDARAPKPAVRARAVRTHVCPACKTPAELDDNFCMNCGKAFVAAPRRCRCGAYPETGEIYCLHCGARLPPE